jgi:RimJ/RimL family protein N-acetyltransferase
LKRHPFTRKPQRRRRNETTRPKLVLSPPSAGSGGDSTRGMLLKSSAPRNFRPMVEIRTERLLLRPFRGDDLGSFVAYRSDPEVARYQSWESTYSIGDAESGKR